MTCEMHNSMIALTKIVQLQCFSTEIRQINENELSVKAKIANLNPFIDSDGILRVGGRLNLSNYDYAKKFPMLLPKRHRFTFLLVEHEHIRLFHTGPQHLLACIRERFWPIDGRNLVRKVIRRCIRCHRFNARAVKCIMGELPEERVTPCRPFLVRGIDYAGPFSLKDRQTKNYKITKAYICLFICLSTKAVHIELVSDLTTTCFLASLRRFFARRGKTNKILSDNATNFVGASKQLKHFLETSKF